MKKRITDLEATDDFPEAIKTAEELLALRERVQGVDHHEVNSANADMTRLQKLSAQSVAKRREYRAVLRGAIQTQSLVAQGRPAQAYPALSSPQEVPRNVPRDLWRGASRDRQPFETLFVLEGSVVMIGPQLVARDGPSNQPT